MPHTVIPLHPAYFADFNNELMTLYKSLRQLFRQIYNILRFFFPP